MRQPTSSACSEFSDALPNAARAFTWCAGSATCQWGEVGRFYPYIQSCIWYKHINGINTLETPFSSYQVSHHINIFTVPIECFILDDGARSDTTPRPRGWISVQHLLRGAPHGSLDLQGARITTRQRAPRQLIGGTLQHNSNIHFSSHFSSLCKSSE